LRPVRGYSSVHVLLERPRHHGRVILHRRHPSAVLRGLLENEGVILHTLLWFRDIHHRHLIRLLAIYR
jgi:hypothetical protein